MCFMRFIKGQTKPVAVFMCVNRKSFHDPTFKREMACQDIMLIYPPIPSIPRDPCGPVRRRRRQG